MAPHLSKSLRDWCDRNSQPITSFKHLCMKPVKISRGKKIQLTNPTFVQHLDILAEPFPDIGANHSRELEETIKVKKSALHYVATKLIVQICIPKIHKSPEPREFTIISHAALIHKITDRENSLAKPLKRKNPRPRNYLVIPQAALKYEPTPRIEEMGKPQKRKQGKKWVYKKPIYVKKAALSATASPRIEEIAQPTKHPDRVTKKHPFDVPKPALSYNATDRIIDISKPRRITHKYVNPEAKWQNRFNHEDKTLNQTNTTA